MKYVVGAETPTVEWGPSTRLGAYDADAIRRLKDDTDGVIYVSGSGTLVRGLLADGLVDELHLLVYPIAHDVYDNGVVHLVYGPAA